MLSATLRFVGVIAGGLVLVGASSAFSQDYPLKIVRVVTSPPGGSADFNARVVAQGLTGSLGQTVIVENRASTTIAAQTATHAAPDGYTLLVAANGFWIEPLMRDNVSWDPNAAPIAMTTTTPSVLLVHPSMQVKSVKELIALAKAQPGALNYAAGAPASPPHLAGELFKAMAHTDIVAITYKSGGPALTDLISGQVQLMFGNPASVAPHIKSGRLRALAVTSARPSALFPGLPTIAAAGVPGYEALVITGVFAPAKTPAALIKRLNQEVVRVLSSADVKERFLNNGLEVAITSPDEFAAAIKSDMASMGKVIKDKGIRLE